MRRFLILAAILVLNFTLKIPASALTCSTLPLPSNDLGARLDMLHACLTDLGGQMKLECQRPLDNLIAATLAAEGEQDREKKDELLKLFENALSAFNASQLKCTEMKQDFDTSMARYHHDMELSRGELEAVKRYEYSLHHHGEK